MATTTTRPVYDGTATSRQAQAAWDSAQKANAGAPAGWKGYNGISYADSQWYYDYNKKIQSGQNNSYKLKQYQDMVKKYGLKDYSKNIGEDALRDLSRKALTGDTNAQTYLKNMNYQQMSGDGLWKGITDDQLNSDAKLRDAYMQANQTADYTKRYDVENYNKYNQMIQNNEAMTDWQRDWYAKTAAKWGLDDYNDPFIQQREQSKKDQKEYLDNLQKDNTKYSGDLQKAYEDYLAQMGGDKTKLLEELQKAEQSAMDGQDVALNQSMAQMDANSFQQFQQLQQQMADRGMGDSGIASDAYMRAQMANNQNYQQAFADAAVNKANIKGQYTDKRGDVTTQYTDKIGQGNIDKTNSLGQLQSDYTDKVGSTKAQYTDLIGKLNQGKREYDDQKAQAEAQAQAEILKSQTEQDKYLTSSTGYVYLNGQMLRDSKGNPMSSVDLMKLEETSRHNQSTEDISRMKIQADVQKASAQLQLAYDKLDKDWYVANANIDKAKAQLDIAARNAATKEQSNAITAIKSKITAVQGQVKNGKPTKAQQQTLKDLMTQLDAVVGGK